MAEKKKEEVTNGHSHSRQVTAYLQQQKKFPGTCVFHTCVPCSSISRNKLQLNRSLSMRTPQKPQQTKAKPQPISAPCMCMLRKPERVGNSREELEKVKSFGKKF